jgi:methylenetetrahydrofolate reductase (NADPH)
MRIAELYARRDRPVISFEFFPPKTDKGFRTLFRTIEELKRLDPGFVSVTMGAGGSTRAKTVDLVAQIHRQLGLTSMAHLPCVGFEREHLGEVLDRLEREGLENVLALSGDPPQNPTDFVRPRDGFRYANELVSFIRTRWELCVGGGCYPETHQAAPSPEVDLENLVRKVNAGTDFLISQLFFENRNFFAFVERARAGGIRVPIVPGIMPIVSAQNIRKITALCGAIIPEELARELARVEGDDDATMELGIRWATAQCRELLERGAPGIHFYTLNRSPASRRITEALFRS